jgi:hypothetical protein
MSTDPKTPETVKPEDANARQPYARPRLRRLGTVRDLTLGSAGATGDGKFSKKRP